MRLLYITVLLLCSMGWAIAAPVRIKDLANIDGVRGNDLVGYGLVVGLNGSGDSLRNSPFTEEIVPTHTVDIGKILDANRCCDCPPHAAKQQDGDVKKSHHR